MHNPDADPSIIILYYTNPYLQIQLFYLIFSVSFTPFVTLQNMWQQSRSSIFLTSNVRQWTMCSFKQQTDVSDTRAYPCKSLNKKAGSAPLTGHTCYTYDI